MVTKANEQALEVCIDKALTGTCREDQKQAKNIATTPEPIWGPHAGYEAGHPQDFDCEFAIDKEKFWRFLKKTQARELKKLKDRPNWQRLLLERLNCKIQKEGTIKVLKSGLSIDDAHFTLLYSLPFNDINPKVAERFEDNIFSVTRQVHYSQKETMLSIDMVLFINGLAIATIELKNAWTSQTTFHACKQYR
ncbi:MAG: type I restriction endonuclease, partial [Pseudomonadota bacterium]